MAHALNTVKKNHVLEVAQTLLVCKALAYVVGKSNEEYMLLPMQRLQIRGIVNLVLILAVHKLEILFVTSGTTSLTDMHICTEANSDEAFSLGDLLHQEARSSLNTGQSGFHVMINRNTCSHPHPRQRYLARYTDFSPLVFVP
jgi:hypothetical protein